uniref:Uncharacterized protein n=1 Tax=Tanacetum cinerariifolium TaxID=118510 RepID=A0A6L2IZU4_TANCI|nr:hypothetical protein [Tanacetum cinerariifolium]
MAVPVGGNEVARRVVNDLNNFSGQTSVKGYMNFIKAQQIFEVRRFVNRMHEEVQTSRNQIAQLNALITEIEAFVDPREVFNTLLGLRDDKRVKNAKLMGLNELITHAEEEIEMKEAYLEAMDGVNLKFSPTLSHGYEVYYWLVFDAWFIMLHGMRILRNWMRMLPLGVWQRLKALKCFYLYVSCGAKYCIMPAYLVCQLYLVYIGPFFILDKFFKVTESPRLADKMKYVFGRLRGKDESFAGLMRDLCCSLRISLSKKRKQVAELEAVGEVEGAEKSLEHMRVIVARDDVTLGELETLFARAQVGVSLKVGFVTDMEVKD